MKLTQSLLPFTKRTRVSIISFSVLANLVPKEGILVPLLNTTTSLVPEQGIFIFIFPYQPDAACNLILEVQSATVVVWQDDIVTQKLVSSSLVSTLRPVLYQKRASSSLAATSTPTQLFWCKSSSQLYSLTGFGYRHCGSTHYTELVCTFKCFLGVEELGSLRKC